MTHQITHSDFCGLCGSLLDTSGDVTCARCDKFAEHLLGNTRNIKKSKAVIQLDKSGNEINRYGSLTHASVASGVDIGAISKVCSDKAKSAGGYLWMYETRKLKEVA